MEGADFAVEFPTRHSAAIVEVQNVEVALEAGLLPRNGPDQVIVFTATPEHR